MGLTISICTNTLLSHSKEYTLELSECRVLTQTDASDSESMTKESDGDPNNKLSNTYSFRLAVLPKERVSENVKRRHYEGGYTLWESTWFLLSVLHKEMESSKGSIVIDLGCGNGICGVLALQRGYDVLFQDLNWDVLENAVIPNVLLNLCYSDLQKLVNARNKQKSGQNDDSGDSKAESTEQDHVHKIGAANSVKPTTSSNINVILKSDEGEKHKYGSVAKLTTMSVEVLQDTETLKRLSNEACNEDVWLQNKVDLLACLWEDIPSFSDTFLEKYSNSCAIIVASECIYRKENYPAIANILLHYLKADEGVAYIASKRLYFGMDGGSLEFRDYINKHHKYSANKLEAAIHRTHMLPKSSNVIDIVKVTKTLTAETL